MGKLTFCKCHVGALTTSEIVCCRSAWSFNCAAASIRCLNAHSSAIAKPPNPVTMSEPLSVNWVSSCRRAQSFACVQVSPATGKLWPAAGSAALNSDLHRQAVKPVQPIRENEFAAHVPALSANSPCLLGWVACQPMQEDIRLLETMGQQLWPASYLLTGCSRQ